MNKSPAQTGTSAGRNYLPYLVTSLVLVVVACVRIRLLAVPLERDEGEFAYMGQLLLKGFPPFTYAYTMKLPGVSIVYALGMYLFGQSPAGIHLGLLVINFICIALVYLVATRLFDSTTALVSCATYAVLSLSQSVLGIFAHATHLVMLFSLTGLLILLYALDSGRRQFLFVSGLCFGLAVTMKQHALLLALLPLFYCVRSVWRKPVTGRKFSFGAFIFFILGMIIPYALLVIWVTQAGVFDRFWFWTVAYSREYASGYTLLQGWRNFAQEFSTILTSQPFLWLLAGIGAVSLGTQYSRCRNKGFVFWFLLLSCLSVCPGLIFRNHYFVLMLPVAALLVGAAFRSSSEFSLQWVQSRKLSEAVFLLVWGVAVVSGLFIEREYLFIKSPTEMSRFCYGLNPFPEALEIARYLKDRSNPGDTIAVLGSEPEILFYADRLSATGHIYMYGLMENQSYAERMQLQLIREVEQSRPKYVVYVSVAMSWLVEPSSSRAVFKWGENYLRSSYEPVGLIDIIDSTATSCRWDAQAAGSYPSSGTYLRVFRRKAGV